MVMWSIKVFILVVKLVGSVMMALNWTVLRNFIYLVLSMLFFSQSIVRAPIRTICERSAVYMSIILFSANSNKLETFPSGG